MVMPRITSEYSTFNSSCHRKKEKLQEITRTRSTPFYSSPLSCQSQPHHPATYDSCSIPPWHSKFTVPWFIIDD
ncbi:hypothetical protein M0657_007581 [Pyricularia oryzae]|nr:hypothetical protein M9X92_008617 [Pyricularia oryzae]KAI7918460.1 hypothetical protein M0657_007581 [Pyricularia oryzae]